MVERAIALVQVQKFEMELCVSKREPSGGSLGKFSCLRDDGVHLGPTTGELVIGTRSGAWKTRSVRRKPTQQRCAIENMSLTRVVP